LTAEKYSFSGPTSPIPPSPPQDSPPSPLATAEITTHIPQHPAIPANMVQIPHSLLRPFSTNHFFTLDDFADDDTFGRKSQHPRDDPNRPRSSDSSSTAPFDPIGSPHSPMLDLDNRTDAYCAVSRVAQTPKGRVERMMSCAAARGKGQCNCGLGDWFHHAQA
jgi:hypothetical protein